MKILQIWQNRNKVLGKNARNLDFIRKYSSPRGRKIADDKLLTKEVLIENQIKTPKLIGVIKDQRELSTFDWDSLPKSFVMKPVRGVQGNGIEIFYNKDKDGNWIRANGSKVNLNYLKNMAREILEGRYSLGSRSDQVFFEERVRTHKELKNYTYKGTPDVRVVVFNKIPVMAYVRFPTKESNGKANMILGAVGTGVDLSSGVTTTSTYGKANNGKGKEIEFVPGTKLRYQGLKIPKWNDLLKLSIQTQIASGLKFVAVDFLIDDERGPLVVEINSRPGISIQIVNRVGLAWRLEKVKGLKVKNISQGIRIGKDLFGGEIEEEIQKVSGKEVIGNRMPVTLMHEDKKVKTIALIDTSRRTTIIESKAALDLGIIDEPIPEGEYEIETVKIKLGTQTFDSECRIVHDQVKGHRVLIGRKDLGDFIIDIKKAEKAKEKELREKVIASRPKMTLEALDESFRNISKLLAILPALKPTNLEEEKKKFFESKFEYNPIFKYKPIRFNPDFLLVQLNYLNPPDTEIGELYYEKIKEFKNMVYLIEAIGRDSESFTEKSIRLYGKPKLKYLKKADEIIEKGPVRKKEDSKFLEFDEVKKRIQEVLDKYELDSEIVLRDSSPPTSASIGKETGKIFINKNFKWTENKLNGMIAHEILTHLIRRKNGLAHEYGIFALGTANYLATEEGLATLMKQSALEEPDWFISALRYRSINIALKSSFVETFEFLNVHVDENRAFDYTVRVKRGIENTKEVGAFTKDQYFGWAYELAYKLEKDIDIVKTLLNGKGSLNSNKKFEKDTSPIEITIDLKKLLDGLQQ